MSDPRIKKIPMTPGLWETLKRVNLEWNRKIEYQEDLDHYGQPEWWNFPEDHRGDCEDYAIAKRRALHELGIKSYFATCWTETNGYHAVLLVDTDKGTYVLDNRREYPRPWLKLEEGGYLWDHREMEDGNWYEIGEE